MAGPRLFANISQSDSWGHFEALDRTSWSPTRRSTHRLELPCGAHAFDLRTRGPVLRCVKEVLGWGPRWRPPGLVSQVCPLRAEEGGLIVRLVVLGPDGWRGSQPGLEFWIWVFQENQ